MKRKPQIDDPSVDLLDTIEEAITPAKIDCVEYMRENTKGLSDVEILQSSSELSVHIDDCIDQTKRMFKRLRELAVEMDISQVKLCEYIIESVIKLGEGLDLVYISNFLLGFRVSPEIFFNLVKFITVLKNKGKL